MQITQHCRVAAVPCCFHLQYNALLPQALTLALPSLQQLKLSHVAGLCDEGVEALSRLTGLVDLSVVAPHNKALTQSSLALLAPLRCLR
jgi:hypothetical protein